MGTLPTLTQLPSGRKVARPKALEASMVSASSGSQKNGRLYLLDVYPFSNISDPELAGVDPFFFQD
jgi:hypothetical protein